MGNALEAAKHLRKACRDGGIDSIEEIKGILSTHPALLNEVRTVIIHFYPIMIKISIGIRQ